MLDLEPGDVHLEVLGADAAAGHPAALPLLLALHHVAWGRTKTVSFCTEIRKSCCGKSSLRLIEKKENS